MPSLLLRLLQRPSTVGCWLLATALAAPLPAMSAKQSASPAKQRVSASLHGPTNHRASASPRAKTSAKRTRRASVVRVAPPRVSVGHRIGLHTTDDPLDLKSSVALVIDQDTQQVLFSKNPDAVLPIASITKLMTALIVTEAQLPLDEVLTISQADVDTEKGSRSRLRVGTQLTRGEMLQLALMSSENRAAHALGRTYPGGLERFVAAMNAKAQLLGMSDTRYVEPTGLSSSNRSSATDLARLVAAAYEYQLIRELSTTTEAHVEVGNRRLRYGNTNGLVRSPSWDIGLQKTGYISEAGRCLVMQAELAGRNLIMVLLDSAGRYSRIGDAERLRKWLVQGYHEVQDGIDSMRSSNHS